MQISKTDVSRSNLVMFSLHFTREKGYVRALNPNSLMLKNSKPNIKNISKYTFSIHSSSESSEVSSSECVSLTLSHSCMFRQLLHWQTSVHTKTRTFLVGARPFTRARNQFKNLQKNEFLLLVLLIKIYF